MTKPPEAFRQWQADYRRHLATRPDPYPGLSVEDKIRLRAEDKARERARDAEWKAWHDAAVRGMRKTKPARDIDALVNAAVWLTHLFPGVPRARGLDDVVRELLACPVPAVRALVGKAKHKRLRNLLAPAADYILTSDPSALTDADEWAEQMDLPALPLAWFADTVLMDWTVVRPSRVPSHARDGLLLARAIRDSDVADTLPPAARNPLQRLLARLARLNDDELANLVGDDNYAAE
jgi:hypothetical protein